MGNTRSEQEREVDIWWDSEPATSKSELIVEETRGDRQKRMKEELDEFKLELARKHEKRRQLIVEKRKEMEELRREVKRLKEENEELRANRRLNGTNDLEDIRQKNLELKVTIAKLQNDLQDLNSEMMNFEKEREDYKAHVVALKDVVSVSKQMLMIREAQLKELREKVKEIEASLAGKELKVLSQDLRAEYEKQLQNIRNLRLFYEERQRADKKEKEDLKKLLEDTKKELQDEKNKNTELNENLDRLEEDSSKKYDEIKNLESNLGLTKAECRQYEAELSVINQLFSQILLAFNNNKEIDIQKLIKLLEENHHLLQDIAINEESNQVSALPKVLLDLVNEVSDGKDSEDVEEESTKINPETQISNQLNSATEIVENLPKVWKVLIELLSHQCAPVINEEEQNENPCYKLVDSPKGPHLVLSVSKTFIRLKDLILEKKSLERETCRLKHLNTHLECRLQEQEKRLELVTNELSDTWLVVGKLQKKHQLLHTQEKILRYELAQKRKLLTELKTELEYSREKWLEAREKNSNTEKQWEQLRIEFASRKTAGGEDSNNSVESGYSDDKESSEDEPGYESDISEGNPKQQNEEKVTIDDVLTRDGRLLGLENQCPGLIKETSNGNVTVESDASDEIYAQERENGEGSKMGDVDEVSETRSEQENQCSSLVEQTTDASSSRSENGEGSSRDEVNPKQEGKEKTIDDVLSEREERLKRLESQCSNLVRQVTNTSNKSAAIENKLEALHETYGEGRQDGEGSSREDGNGQGQSSN